MKEATRNADNVKTVIAIFLENEYKNREQEKKDVHKPAHLVRNKHPYIPHVIT